MEASFETRRASPSDPDYHRVVLDRFQSRTKYRQEKAGTFGMKAEDFNRMFVVMAAALAVGGASVEQSEEPRAEYAAHSE